MSWLWIGLLWVSARGALGSLRLRRGEVWLTAGLLACFESVAAVALLSQFGALRPVCARGFCAGLILLHAGAAWAFRRSLQRLPCRRGRRTMLWPLWPAALAIASTAAFRLYAAKILPPDSWDGLSYHLPIAYHWIRAGSLSLKGWPGAHRYFPLNGEMLMAWLALLEGGSLDSAKMAQLLALPLWAAAAYVSGRRLAGSWAWACALAALSVPIALIHAGMPYVDLIYSAFWLATAAAALCYARTGRLVYLAAASLAFGLALGTKATAYFLLPLALPVLWTWRKRPLLLRPAAKASLALGALAMAAGGGSYLRNWLATGNPVFPYAWTLFGFPLLKGIIAQHILPQSMGNWFVSSPWGWWVYPLLDTAKGAVAYSSENGFGPLFAAGWVLSPYLFWDAWKRRDHARLSFLCLLPVSLLFFFTLHPVRHPRYAIFLSAVPILGLAGALSRARGLWRILALCGWSAGILWSSCGVLASFGQDQTFRQTWEDLEITGRIDPFEYYRQRYGAPAQAWRALNERLLPGEIVVVNYDELLLPWAGVPPRGEALVLSSTPNNYPQTYQAATPEAWVKLIGDLKARYVVVWSPAWYPEYLEIGSKEWNIVSLYPQRFKPVGEWSSPGMGKVGLFEFKPS